MVSVRSQPTFIVGRLVQPVTFDGSDLEVPRDIAMHIAAAAPTALDETEISKDLLERERNIYIGQAESLKVEEIVEKMAVGKIKKIYQREYVTWSSIRKGSRFNSERLAKSKGLALVSFTRMAVGDGIGEKTEDFAEEVAKQVGKKN